MSDLAPFIIVFVIVCIVITVVVWQRIGTSEAPGHLDTDPHDEQTERRAMQGSDWANATVNVVLGVFLGVLVVELIRLMTTAFWPVAVLMPLLFAGLLIISGVFDRLVEKIFPIEIRPARKPKPERRAPLPRILSMPVGVMIGIVLAWLGLGDILLGWLS